MDQVLAWVGIGAGVVIGAYFMATNRPEVNDKVRCPHCDVTGHVTVGPVVRKKGISGGKATGALMTGGASMFLVGLSRKEMAQHFDCGNCGIGWDVA